MKTKPCKDCGADISNLHGNSVRCETCSAIRAKLQQREYRDKSQLKLSMPPCARKSKELYQFAKWILDGVKADTIPLYELEHLFQSHKKDPNHPIEANNKKRCVLKILAIAMQLYRHLYTDRYKVYDQEDWQRMTQVGAIVTNEDFDYEKEDTYNDQNEW